MEIKIQSTLRWPVIVTLEKSTILNKSISLHSFGPTNFVELVGPGAVAPFVPW